MKKEDQTKGVSSGIIKSCACSGQSCIVIYETFNELCDRVNALESLKKFIDSEYLKINKEIISADNFK